MGNRLRKSHCLVDDWEVMVAAGWCACTRRGNLNDKGHEEEIEDRQGPLYQADYEGNKRSNMAQKK